MSRMGVYTVSQQLSYVLLIYHWLCALVAILCQSWNCDQYTPKASWRETWVGYAASGTFLKTLVYQYDDWRVAYGYSDFEKILLSEIWIYRVIYWHRVSSTWALSDQLANHLYFRDGVVQRITRYPLLIKQVSGISCRPWPYLILHFT